MSYNSWNESTIGSIIENFDKLRKPISSMKRDEIKGIYPYYGAANIIGYINNYTFDGHYVLIAEDGSVINASGNPIIQNVRGKFWVSNHSHVLKGNEKIDTDFLYYYLKSIKIKPYLTGSVQLKLNQENLNRIPLRYPLIEKQEKIANILTSFDKKIELNNKINRNLEELAQTLYKHWFVDFEFPNEEGKPYRSSGGEMVESELGLIPIEAEVLIVEDLSSIRSGKRPDFTSDFSDTDMNPVFGASKIMGYTNGFNIENKSFVIGRVGTHGIIQRTNGRAWATDNTLIIEANYYEYIHQYFKLINFSNLNKGSTQPLITQKDIKNLKILKMSNTLHLRFESMLGGIYNLVDNNDSQNKNLNNLRDLLLPKLMSGEIEV